MGKQRIEVVPRMESEMLHQLAPVIDQAFNEHLEMGLRKKIDHDEELEVGTLDPLNELYVASALEPEELLSTDLLDQVHNSYQDHRTHLLEQTSLDIQPVVKLAGLMNLGTEDNISWYHAVQFDKYKVSPEYLRMLSRWTAEESSHGPLMRYWGQMTGAIPSSVSHANMVHQVMGGIGVNVDSIVSTNAFTDPQEGDTVDAHRDLGSILDPIGRRIMNKLSGQENLHKILFRKIGKGIYDLDQKYIDYALPIEAETHSHFGMPGDKSYPNFESDALQIAVNGLFTLNGIIKRQLERVEKLGLLNLNASTEAAKKAQQRIAQLVDPDSRINRFKQSKLDQATEVYIEAEKLQGRIPFILGRTVRIESGTILVEQEAA